MTDAVGSSLAEGEGIGEARPVAAGSEAASSPSLEDADVSARRRRRSRRAAVAHQLRALIKAIREGDDDMVESAVLALSARNRLLAPLALAVGAFAVLFQGIKLLVTNWRLTLIQILPAMWIWLAMLDLKVHVFKGREFNIVRGPVLVPLLLIVMAITVASLFLNSVFGYAIADSSEPDIRAAYRSAKVHLPTIAAWGSVIGLALGFSGLVVTRWGLGWFALSFGIVTGILMFSYVALPSRLLGLKPEMSRRDKLTTSAIGGVVGALVCSPPYWLGRLAIVMLGSTVLRAPAIVLLVVAVVLQTGATSAIKAVKMSAKIVAGRSPAEAAADSST